MQVYHLGKFYPPASGGIETHLRTLAHAQSRLGAHVTVVCVNHRDCAGNDVTWDSLAPTQQTEELDGAVKVIRLGRSASLARFDLCTGLPGLLRRLSRSKFDLLHLHVPNPTMLLAMALVRPRLPWIITYHSDVVRQKLLGRLMRPFENMVFQRAEVVLATSPTYPAGSEYLRRHGSKVHILPFGIDLTPFRSPSAEAMAYASRLHQHGSILWLAVGRLVYYKGFETALRALVHVPGRLLIVGDGPLRDDLGKLSNQLGVADRVIWQSRLSDAELVGAYHAATALWFPSNARSEAFGFVQIEAMACGCPVINTNIPGSGVAWVSRHEETGLTVPVNDPLAFAAAAQRLLDDPAFRNVLGQAARERAQREFGDDLMVRRTLEVYEKVLSSPRSAAGNQHRFNGTALTTHNGSDS